MICSSRSPVRSARSTYGTGGGAEQRGHQSFGRHVLAQQERALLEVAGQPALDGEEHERALVAEQPLAARAASRSSSAVSPDSTTNSTWAGSVEAGCGHGRPEVLRARCPRRTASRAPRGCPSAQPRTALLTSGRRAVSATSEHDPAEHEREDRNLSRPPSAAAARHRRRGRSGRRRGSAPTIRRDDVGRVRVRVVRMRLRGAGIAGASAGADRHAWLSEWSLGPGQGRAGPGACVELVLEDDRGRLAVDAGPIGVALGLASAARPTDPLHRTEAVLGEVAGQALVAKG